MQSHTCGHWHTQRLECSPLLPTPISAVLTPTSGTPRPAPRFYLPIWTFPFQVDVQVLGVPGVDFVPLANSPASLRALLLVHAGCATLILVRVRLGPGGAASKGRPRPEGHPAPRWAPTPKASPVGLTVGAGLAPVPWLRTSCSKSGQMTGLACPPGILFARMETHSLRGLPQACGHCPLGHFQSPPTFIHFSVTGHSIFQVNGIGHTLAKDSEPG